MVLYDVVISPEALHQLEQYIDYVRYVLQNSCAAADIWRDAMETRDRLSMIAGSLGYCSDPRLRELDYRAIRFSRHRYIMLYRTQKRTVYVDAVYHQLQDCGSHIFKSDLD